MQSILLLRCVIRLSVILLIVIAPSIQTTVKINKQIKHKFFFVAKTSSIFEWLCRLRNKLITVTETFNINYFLQVFKKEIGYLEIK